MLDTHNCLENHTKNAKTTKFLLQPSFCTSKGRTCNFYDFLFKFYDKLCSPYLIDFYAYLITKIGNCNLNSSCTLTDSLPQWYISLNAESNDPYLMRLVNELFQSTFIRKTHFGKIHWPSCHFSSCLGGCQILRTVYNHL